MLFKYIECFLHFIIETTLCIEFIFWICPHFWYNRPDLEGSTDSKEGRTLLLRYYHDHKLCKLQGCFTPVYRWYHCHTLVPDRFPVSPPTCSCSQSLLAVWSQLLHLPVALPGVELFPHVVALLAPSLHSALRSNTTQMSALSLMQSSLNTQTSTAYFLTCVCFP